MRHACAWWRWSSCRWPRKAGLAPIGAGAAAMAEAAARLQVRAARDRDREATKLGHCELWCRSGAPLGGGARHRCRRRSRRAARGRVSACYVSATVSPTARVRRYCSRRWRRYAPRLASGLRRQPERSPGDRPPLRVALQQLSSRHACKLLGEVRTPRSPITISAADVFVLATRAKLLHGGRRGAGARPAGHQHPHGAIAELVGADAGCWLHPETPMRCSAALDRVVIDSHSCWSACVAALHAPHALDTLPRSCDSLSP